MFMPKEVQEVFNDPATIKVLATRSGDNLNVIPLGSLRIIDANTIVCAAIYMRETHENLRVASETGAKVSTLAVKMVPGTLPQAYQVRCLVKTFMTAGPLFEGMREAIRDMGMETRGVWVFEPLEVLEQMGPNAGKKIA